MPFDKEKQCDALERGLREREVQIGREKIMDVLVKLAEDHTEVDDKGLEEIQERVLDTIQKYCGMAGLGAFAMVIVGTLEENGALQKEEIPEEIDIPEATLDKLSSLGELEKNRKVVAYIILNSKTEAEVLKKCGAAHFGCDATQMLMPRLHALMKIDPTVKERIVRRLSQLEIAKKLSDEPNWIDDYCFREGNTQPYFIFDGQYPDIEFTIEEEKELLEVFVSEMLEILREYLSS